MTDIKIFFLLINGSLIIKLINNTLKGLIRVKTNYN